MFTLQKMSIMRADRPCNQTIEHRLFAAMSVPNHCQNGELGTDTQPGKSNWMPDVQAQSLRNKG